MAKSQKVWVIDESGKDAWVQEESIAGTPTSGNRERSPRKAQQLFSQPRSRTAPADRGVVAHEVPLGALVAFTYLLGPFALLLTARGRRGKLWVVLGATAGLSGFVLALTWQEWLAGLTPGTMIASVWFLTALATVGLGFTAWAWGLLVNGSTAGVAAQRLPWWCRAPVAVGALGFLLPGFGMLVMGRPRRAAWTLWLLGPVVQAVLILAHADWLWQGTRGASPGVPAGSTLEIIFLVATGVLCAGIVFWLFQALDSVRLVTHGVGARRSRRVYWLTAALGLTIVLFGVRFDPARLAEDLDRYATALQVQGMQIIPLTLTHGAVHLDPARPAYLIHTADLYAEIGREDRAVALRQELSAKWLPYARKLRQDTRWFTAASSPLLSGRTAGEVTWSGTDNAENSPGPKAEGLSAVASNAGRDLRHGPYLDVKADRNENLPPE